MASHPPTLTEGGFWTPVAPAAANSSTYNASGKSPVDSYASPASNGQETFPPRASHHNSRPAHDTRNHRQLRPVPRSSGVVSSRSQKPSYATQLAPDKQIDATEKGHGKHKPQKLGNNQPTAEMQPEPGRQGNWRVRRILQQLRESGAADPYLELRLPVLVHSASFEKHALLALFSQRLERSLVTASAVRFLGFQPMDLPPDANRKRFATPWGFIRPKRFVRLVLEQVRNDLPPVPADILVLDDNFLDYGIDIFVGRRFLAATFGGNLPPKASVATSGQTFAQQTESNNQSGWGIVNPVADNNTNEGFSLSPWPPLALVEDSSLQSWSGHPGWNQQAGALPLPLQSEGLTYRTPASPMPLGPIAPVEYSYPDPAPAQTLPSLDPATTPWNHRDDSAPYSAQWQFGASGDSGFGNDGWTT